MRSRIRRFTDDTLLRSAGLLAGGTAMGQAVTVLASPLLTRLYSPDDFGMLAVYASIIGMLTVVSGLRFELAIPVAEDKSLALNALLLSQASVISMAALIAWLTYAVGSELLRWTGALALAPHMWLIPVGVVMAGTYQSLNYWALRDRGYRDVAVTKLLQGISQTSVQAVLGATTTGAAGLLLGHAVGQAAGISTLFRRVSQDLRVHLKQTRASALLITARRYWRFPALSAPSGLLNSAGLLLPPLVLAGLYGPDVAGFYALSERVVKTPLNLISRSVGQVYFVEAAKLAHDSPSKLLPLFLRTARQLFLIGLLPTLILGLLAPWIFAQLFGQDWRIAGQFTQILSAMYLVQFVVNPLSQTLNLLERQDIQAVWDILRLIVVLGVFISAARLGYSVYITVALYSLGMLICYVFLFYIGRLQLRLLKRA